jgi:hypothetical protein
MSISGSNNPLPKARELTRKSVIIFFAIGAVLLAVPVGAVLTENALCRVDTVSCIHTGDYRFLISTFPYVMLGGGVLIAFNMKRISDSINAPDNDENEEGSDDGPLTSLT